jgi:hypothetical protein
MVSYSLPPKQRRRWRLWIGGSSGLAQTYHAAYPNSDNDDDDDDGYSWIWMGGEPEPPDWMKRTTMAANGQPLTYVACNLLHVAAVAAKPADDSSLHSLSTSSSSSLLSRVFCQMDTIMASSRQLVVSNDQPIATTGSSEPLLPFALDQIVIGIRPPLITHRSHVAAHRHGQALLEGLRRLLSALMVRYGPPTLLLHISSIAAVHHILPQLQRSVQQADPPSTALAQPYDCFKRACEELVESLATATTTTTTTTPNNNNNNIQWTNVRLGAIFSDPATCIQCGALAVQSYTGGPYLPTRIDCNSSRNASHLIHLILLKHSCSRSSSSSSTVPLLLLPVYYYTRCVSQYPQPVPYGEFLVAYHEAANPGAPPQSVGVGAGCRRCYLWLPHWLVLYCFVIPFHWCAIFFSKLLPWNLPFLESLDYLLQVTIHEHTFDMKETVEHFPELLQLEETMLACFQRRRRMMQNTTTTGDKKKR